VSVASDFHSPWPMLFFFISSDVEATSSKRSWIISQLGSLIKHSSIPKTDQWIQTILDWFVVHGLFVVVKENKKSTLVAVRELKNILRLSSST
jgi:DNA polymerase phi